LPLGLLLTLQLVEALGMVRRRALSERGWVWGQSRIVDQHPLPHTQPARSQQRLRSGTPSIYRQNGSWAPVTKTSSSIKFQGRVTIDTNTDGALTASAGVTDR
jgi:hypothetical protein